MAAGLSLPTKNIEAFRREINRYAAKQKEMPIPSLTLDCRLNPAALRVELPELLEEMEPFGEGNPSPLFGLYGMTLKEISPVGSGKHLRLGFGKGSASVHCMKFSTTAEEFPYRIGDVMDLAVSLDAREFRGEKNLSVVIRDCRPSDADFTILLKQERLYEKLCRKEPLSREEKDSLLPRREDFAGVYRFLRQNGGWNGPAMFLWYRMKLTSLHMGRLLFLLDIMEERGLITRKNRGGRVLIELRPVQGKVDLNASPLMGRLAE